MDKIDRTDFKKKLRHIYERCLVPILERCIKQTIERSETPLINYDETEPERIKYKVMREQIIKRSRVETNGW